jgi:PIN domain nuclease of toxin-antitoxin system
MQLAFFDWLPLKEAHFDGLLELPFHHRDPFDRMLVTQSRSEQMPIVSADAMFDLYGVTRIWN